MIGSRFTTRAVLSLGMAVALAGVLPAQDDPAPPDRFRATVMVLSGPSTSMARLAIAIDRWSTNEEKSALVQALKSGGTDALVAAMENLTVGYLQVDSELRWPIRVASTWKTDKGQVVRLGTNRPIFYGELAKGSRTADYPIGIVEFTVPPTGRGEGALIAATQAGFDDKGRIEMRSMPSNTGAQKVTNVEREKPKKAKEKN